MSIKVVLGAKIYVIHDKSITFQQLLKDINQRFGTIADLQRKITYKYRNKVSFIVDEATLQRAKDTFPKELCISIQEDSASNNNFHAFAFKSYSAINGVDASWNEEEWLNNILKAQPSTKLPVVVPIKQVQHKLDKEVVQAIDSNNAKSQRFGHTTDPIESFMMSCYHLDARNKGLDNKQIDKALWNLNRWRRQQRRQNAKIAQPTSNSQKIVPILKLEPGKNDKGHQSCQLFSKKGPKYIIQDPNAQDFQLDSKNGPVLVNSEKTDDPDLKYYLIDQAYHQLSLFAQGKADKASLFNLISLFRKYTDEDGNFIVKVFEAYVEYSKDGVIYYAPTSDHSGMLPFIRDDEIVGILGDWGTGEADANSLLEELVYNQNASVILHLGDVYYAGFPEEFEKISSKMRQLQKERPYLRYYTVPGNHDYYTYGGPFYNHLKNNHINKAFNQEFAFFCLRNQSQTVQFIGLDTGKNEHDITTPINAFFEGTYLEQSELEWAIKRIQEFPGKTILLTHHQLFSPFEAILGSLSAVGQLNPEINNKLATQLFEVMPKLTCWMWGHEHRFTTFKDNSFGVNRSILAGNSSFQNNEEEYYEVKYPCDNIVEANFHPEKGELGYYHHTGIVMQDFMGPEIKAKYVYMTSSFDQPSIKVKEKTDTISGPVHLDIQYKKSYQMIEQSGLSVSFVSDDIHLDSSPTSLQFINPNNPNDTGRVNVNDDVLIRIENTLSYLYYSTWGYVEPGEYESEYRIEKHKYLWRLVRRAATTLKTGEIFTLFSVSRGASMTREMKLRQFKLSSSENPSKFYLYSRETTALQMADKAGSKTCCSVM